MKGHDCELKKSNSSTTCFRLPLFQIQSFIKMPYGWRDLALFFPRHGAALAYKYFFLSEGSCLSFLPTTSRSIPKLRTFLVMSVRQVEGWHPHVLACRSLLRPKPLFNWIMVGTILRLENILRAFKGRALDQMIGKIEVSQQVIVPLMDINMFFYMNFWLPFYILCLRVQYQKFEDERNMGVYQNNSIRPACSLFFLSLAKCILKTYDSNAMVFLLFRTFLSHDHTAAGHDRSLTIASDLTHSTLSLEVCHTKTSGTLPHDCETKHETNNLCLRRLFLFL